MNIGFFGIQYSFGLQQTAINPIYSFLGANPDELPLLNLAGPVTGLLIQPIIGAMSDRTWSPRWGRRKPYFLVGAMLCSICLFLFPFSSSLWMAAGLLWVLDAANNTAMEPYRAFVADKLPSEQQPTGFLTQSFFTGLGITLANLSLFGFQYVIKGQTTAGIPYWVFGSFLLGSVCSLGSVLWSTSKTPEIPPTADELAHMHAQPKGFIEPFKDIFSAIGNMPKVMWQLALVYLFQWYALFVYWQFSTPSIAKSIYKINAASENPAAYEAAVGWTGLVNGFYNIVTFLTAFWLAKLLTRHAPKKIHAICLVLAGLGLAAFAFIDNKYLLFLPMVFFGTAWASMMGVPYSIVVHKIPKEKYGVYMGIINMMIVIPMLIQTATFKHVYNGILGANPTYAMVFAGVLLIIAAFFTIRIDTEEN